MGDDMKHKLEVSTKFNSFNEKVLLKNSRVKERKIQDEHDLFKTKAKKWQKETYKYV